LKFSKSVAGIAAAVALAAGFTHSDNVLDWFNSAVRHYTHAERERGNERGAERSATAARPKEAKEGRRGTLSEREALALYSPSHARTSSRRNGRWRWDWCRPA
jgi:hypothetical protein